MQFEEPLFNIHLNVDYPFNLTGILYFPRLGQDMNMQKDKIQLYQNQVFVTDNVEGIVPEFLTMLRGVIDSPDIPLNVSRSYLQADGNVKKISSYITRFLTFEELQEKIKDNQTDKDDKLVVLYASNKDEQHAYITAAKDKGYEVLLLDSPIVSHLIQKLETSKENITFVRVDADHVNNLIKKDEETISKLSDEEKEALKGDLEKVIPAEKYTVQLEAMDSAAAPFMITQPEFMRRMKEMQQTGGGGGMFGMGNMPEMYNLVVNTNHELISQIKDTKTAKKKERLIKQSLDLARLSQNLLKGEELTAFINRSFEMIK